MDSTKQTLEQYQTEFERILKARHGIEINDCTDEDSIRQAFESGQNPVEYVEHIATKYDLDRIDKIFF